ncbi:MAG: Uma2 family endonuclease [Isosphaerales bacterium]
MTMITSPPRRSPAMPSPHPPTAFSGEQRIAIRGLSWDLYDRLSDAIGERQHVYLAYDGKDLEIMTKGPVHEDYRALFGRLMNALTFELAIPSSDLGETTWKQSELARGLEADQCYYFQTEKLAINAAARARKSNDVADYPNPDLAIEIDISPSQVDRPEIFAALQVAEVWRFDGESLTIEQLGPDGKYITRESSRFLPIRTEEVVRWLVEEDVSDRLAWERRLRAWIRAELAPRLSS